MQWRGCHKQSMAAESVLCRPPALGVVNRLSDHTAIRPGRANFLGVARPLDRYALGFRYLRDLRSGPGHLEHCLQDRQKHDFREQLLQTYRRTNPTKARIMHSDPSDSNATNGYNRTLKDIAKLDIQKLHAEVNQLRNFELLCCSFAIALVSASAPAFVKNASVGTAFVFGICGIAKWLSVLMTVRSRITTYLRHG